MKTKMYSQEEVTRTVTVRLGRERERMTKDFERRIKKIMASLHLMLYQEMCEMKKESTIETQEPSLRAVEPNEADFVESYPEKK